MMSLSSSEIFGVMLGVSSLRGCNLVYRDAVGRGDKLAFAAYLSGLSFNAFALGHLELLVHGE